MKNSLNFKPTTYKITTQESSSSIEIEGQKLPPPSKRITLNQNNIKVLNAKITYRHKKGDIEFEVSRINHIKSFGEIRLHTNNILYPGEYIVNLEYIGDLDESRIGEKIN